MNIRRIIPMGTKLRYCSVCGYPIHAKDDELTAHETECIEAMITRAKGKPVMIEPFIFEYKNHRGEVATRTVTPISVRFGSTEWHSEPQWLLLAFDHEKQAEREFAMRDIGGDNRQAQ